MLYFLKIWLTPNYPANASAPPTISKISLVIDTCLALLYCKLSSSLSSVALSVAVFLIGEVCTEQLKKFSFQIGI